MTFILSLALLFASVSSSQANVPLHSPARTFVKKYAEGGQWTVHLVQVDSAGWPETLERSIYPSEDAADVRLSIT